MAESPRLARSPAGPDRHWTERQSAYEPRWAPDDDDPSSRWPAALAADPAEAARLAARAAAGAANRGCAALIREWKALLADGAGPGGRPRAEAMERVAAAAARESSESAVRWAAKRARRRAQLEAGEDGAAAWRRCAAHLAERAAQLAALRR